jgi:hypothetical protein
MYSNYFTEIIPYAGYDIKQIAWHECMACGNGHIGVLTSGAPKNDSFIFQNTEFVMPSDEPRCVVKYAAFKKQQKRIIYSFRVFEAGFYESFVNPAV